MHRKSRKVIFWTVLFWILALVWLMPLYSSLTVSFKTMNEITSGNVLGLPRKIYLDNYRGAWDLGIKRYLFNSFLIVILSVTGALLLSSLAAFALNQYNFKGNSFILVMFLFFNMIPPQMNLIPIYRLSKALRIYDTYLSVIMYHIAFQTGFCTFFLSNFMRTLPQSIFDIARVEGASEFKIYLRISLPLSLTALAALGILEFTWLWNDFIWGAVLLQSDALKPVTVGLSNLKAAYVQSWGMENAGALIAILPTILIFIFLRRYFIRGMTSGFGLK